MISVTGTFAEFERALLRERHGEGIRRPSRGGRTGAASLSHEQEAEMKRRVGAGEAKSQVARDLGITRETIYQYLGFAHEKEKRKV